MIKDKTIANMYDEFCNLSVNQIARECNRKRCDQCEWTVKNKVGNYKCLFEFMPCFWKSEYYESIEGE